MRRTEEHHNTPEQVKSYLRTALDIVEAANVPDDLRVPAFANVYQSVSGKQVFFEQPAAVQLDPRLLNGRR